MKSTTTVRRRFRTNYSETAPVGRSVLRWVEKCNSYGKAENRTERGRAPVPDQTINSVYFYFRKNPRRSLRRRKRFNHSVLYSR